MKSSLKVSKHKNHIDIGNVTVYQKAWLPRTRLLLIGRTKSYACCARRAEKSTDRGVA